MEERPHSCTFCYKRFARADECKRHERIHTDTRPFGTYHFIEFLTSVDLIWPRILACTYCPRRFTRKDHLRTHTRCHTKEKPYICPLCARGFARSDERIRHVKTHVKKGEGTLVSYRRNLKVILNVILTGDPLTKIHWSRTNFENLGPRPTKMWKSRTNLDLSIPNLMVRVSLMLTRWRYGQLEQNF